MTEQDYSQTLTITLKTGDEELTFSYTKEEGICSEEMFWAWFCGIWEPMGIDFVKEGFVK